MTSQQLTDRLAVCSWSLQPSSPQDLVAKLQSVGIRQVQLDLDPLRESPQVWGDYAKLFEQRGIRIASGMFRCVGEDYSTLESIRVTGGIAPERTWADNWKNIQATAKVARQMNLKLVTFHAGFLPHESEDPNFQKLLQRLKDVAGLFATAGMTVGLETGQETATVLAQFLQTLNCSNVKVNFDPANMVLYDKGDPIEALRLLGPWICQVHLKDAVRTKLPGTWGEEVPLGTGEVDWKAFFDTLNTLGFTDHLVIEREAGDQRVADIRTAKQVAETQCR
jgi:sugar phosphate isomerase/epimerase